MLVTNNGSQFMKNEKSTLCHLYKKKIKPRTSYVSWTNGLVEGKNYSRSLQEHLRRIMNENDKSTPNGQQM